MSFFGFGQSAEVELVLSDAESRRRVEHKTEEGKKEKYFLFYDGETVSGRVILTLKHPNRRLEHQGIKVEFIGQIGERGCAVAVRGGGSARVPGAESGLRVARRIPAASSPAPRLQLQAFSRSLFPCHVSFPSAQSLM